MKKLNTAKEKQPNLAGKLQTYVVALMTVISLLNIMSCTPDVRVKEKADKYNSASKKLHKARENQQDKYEDLIKAQKKCAEAAEEVNQAYQDSVDAAQETKNAANSL